MPQGRGRRARIILGMISGRVPHVLICTAGTAKMDYVIALT
jgi:hypothetical protein